MRKKKRDFSHPQGDPSQERRGRKNRPCSVRNDGSGFGLALRQQEIMPVERFRVTENGGSFLERHAVLLQVAQGLPGVPREPIIVYTLIQAECKEEALEGQAKATVCPTGAGPQKTRKTGRYQSSSWETSLRAALVFGLPSARARASSNILAMRRSRDSGVRQ